MLTLANVRGHHDPDRPFWQSCSVSAAQSTSLSIVLAASHLDMASFNILHTLAGLKLTRKDPKSAATFGSQL